MKNIVKVYKYKGWTLEYRSLLGWVYFKPGDKMCTVVYVKRKKDALKYLDDDIKELEKHGSICI